MVRLRNTSLYISGGIVLIYLLQHLVPGLNTLSFVASDVLWEPWTIVTSFFLHSPSDYMHLLNNLFFLAVFGFMLERTVGTKRFLAIFFSSGVFANLSAFIFYPNTPVLGASGAVSGIVAAMATLRPRALGLFWGVPVPMWAAFLGWIATNLVGTAATGGNIAFEAHLFGLASGLLFGLYIRRTHPWSERSEDEDEVEFDVEAWEEKYMT